MGGMGSAVAEVVMEEYPVPMKRIGILDRFGQSGKPDALMKYYHLTADDIVREAEKNSEETKIIFSCTVFK